MYKLLYNTSIIEYFICDSQAIQSRILGNFTHSFICRLSSYEMVEFDPITTDSIFENEPNKRQICITFGANTRRTPMVKTLITWLTGRSLLKHQLNVQVIRNAHGSLPVWKVNSVHPLNNAKKQKIGTMKFNYQALFVGTCTL